MNKYIAFILSAFLIGGCDVAEDPAELHDVSVFTAYFEGQSKGRVYVDSDLNLRWNAGDKISVFTNSLNKPYSFSGQTGDTKGNFTEVQSSNSGTPFALSTTYAVFPYDASTVMNQDETIRLTFPSVQSFGNNSFGAETNAMVAVTSGSSDRTLPFKNLCGYLAVRLYGGGSVRSITFSGNNGEKLAGSATVTASHDANPSIVFVEGATETISIDCGDGVALGADADHATEFWFCIPPTTFSKGFTVKVVNTDNVKIELRVASEKTVTRNHKTAMDAKNIHSLKSMTPATQGYITSGKYRNYLKELGIPQADIDKKIADVYAEIFENQTRGAYKDVEVSGKKMGYISDVKNGDVRSEGMSYGLMVAVQLNKPDLFNRLWRWANHYMRHNENSPSHGLFAWQCNTNGSWRSSGSASDGELYFVTSLLLASRRWGSYEEYDYLTEAQTLLNQLFSKDGTGGVTNIINMEHLLINFCPDTNSNRHTDPSYHLPAFYEIWAEMANDGREATYRQMAENARAFLHKATNAITGLNPDQCNFDGTTMQSWWGGSNDEFHYDSWRVPMNIAMDFTLYHKDAEWQSDYANRMVEAVVGKYGLTEFPDQFALNGGTPKSIMGGGSWKGNLRHSIGFVGTMATTSLMIDGAYSQDLVRHMFDQVLEPYADGYYDVYYDGLLYLFALLHLSGNYRMSW